MNKRVQAGEAARAAQLRDQRDTVIQAAVRDGKLSPARRKHWERLWDADPDGTREVLAGLAKNVVPGDDIGSAGGPGRGRAPPRGGPGFVSPPLPPQDRAPPRGGGT